MFLSEAFPDVTFCEGVESPTPGNRYVFGLTWAARQGEKTSIAILNASLGRLVAMRHIEVFGWEIPRNFVLDQATIWKPVTVWSDAQSVGGPNIEVLQRYGLPLHPMTLSRRVKRSLFGELRLALYDRRLTVLADKELLAQMENLHMDVDPASGLLEYWSTADTDAVVAVALGWCGAAYSGLSIRFSEA